MFFLRDNMGHKQSFETVEELRAYIETRHAEEGGFDWISEIKDNRSRHYGCSWHLEIEQI